MRLKREARGEWVVLHRVIEQGQKARSLLITAGHWLGKPAVPT